MRYVCKLERRIIMLQEKEKKGYKDSQRWWEGQNKTNTRTKNSEDLAWWSGQCFKGEKS